MRCEVGCTQHSAACSVYAKSSHTQVTHGTTPYPTPTTPPQPHLPMAQHPTPPPPPPTPPPPLPTPPPPHPYSPTCLWHNTLPHPHHTPTAPLAYPPFSTLSLQVVKLHQTARQGGLLSRAGEVAGRYSAETEN